MNNTAKKVLGIIAFSILVECSILLIVDAIIIFSSGYGIATGVMSVIEFLALSTLAIVGLVKTARDGIEDSINYLKASYIVDLVFVIITTIISMVSYSFVSAGMIVIIVMSVISAISFLISICMYNKVPSSIFALVGIGILLVAVPLRIFVMSLSKVSLVFSISNLALIAISIILFISLLTSKNRYKTHSNYTIFRLGERVYTKFDLVDKNNHKIPALSQVVIEFRTQNGLYKVSYFDDYHGKITVDNVGKYILSRTKPSAVSSEIQETTISSPNKPKEVSNQSSFSTIEEKLKNLQKLRSEGLISEEEFQEKRKKYIDQI